jgi:hypothetical protein
MVNVIGPNFKCRGYEQAVSPDIAIGYDNTIHHSSPAKPLRRTTRAPDDDKPYLIAAFLSSCDFLNQLW